MAHEKIGNLAYSVTRARISWPFAHEWQQLHLIRNERNLLIAFSALAVLLFVALVALVNHQVDRGKSLRLEQTHRVQALNACGVLAGVERDACQQGAMAAAQRFPAVSEIDGAVAWLASRRSPVARAAEAR